MIIRKARLKDSKKIAKLNEKYFHEKGRNWDKLISSKNSEMFVLEDNKEIIGFTGLEYFDWNNTIQIIDIFVHSEYRKKGLGSKLVKYLLNRAKKTKYRCVIAEAPPLNPVIRLYLKKGFRKCGYNDRYYSNKNREIAVFLSYDLK